MKLRKRESLTLVNHSTKTPAASSGLNSPWQNAPATILQPIFAHLLSYETGASLVRNCSHVCSSWHYAASQILSDDTAGSKGPLPPMPVRVEEDQQTLSQATDSTTRAAICVHGVVTIPAGAEASSGGCSGGGGEEAEAVIEGPMVNAGDGVSDQQQRHRITPLPLEV